MFYTFYVNDGYMLALDIPPVGYFRDLQQELTLKTGVQPRDQVFFLSSGEALLGDYALSDYPNVGIENNPIFCVKRISNEKDPINSREEEGIKNLFDNWKRDVEQLHSLPIKITLVNSYCDEFNRGIEVAETLIRYCAKIVSEHQYLSSGWIAVTRNLDENVADIATRYSKVYKICQRLPQIRKHAQNWVANFDIVYDALSKIKIPGSLLATSQTNSSDSDPQPDSPPEFITLLDWIEQKDPLHTIDSLIEHVSHHIEKLEDTDIKKAGEELKIVKDLIKRKDYREIRGIDKRLAMLDAKLVDLDAVFVKLKESTSKLIQTQTQADQNNFRAVISEQRERIDKLAFSLEDFKHHAFLFLNSKMELLRNVRQRLSGWIKQSYERLQTSQIDIMLFDEKFNSFRKRLDLVRQIREAPILFVASVAEVIRRNAFHAEFNEWLILFIQKCSEFIKEENTTRAEFYCKLEKHFLHDIFTGMGDELPNFCPSKIKFDSKLPVVSDDLLRELRDSLKDCMNMESHFTIVYPQVFNRLLITPKSTQQSESREQQTYFHREESFFVRDKSTNPMQSNFPSSQWLSGVADEHSMSPITNQFFMSKAGGSTTSLNSNVTTPSDLVPNLESIQPLNSIPRAMCSPSSVDLTSPSSIHPDRYQRTSKDVNELESSTDQLPANKRPVFQAGDDSEISLTAGTDTSDSTTPQYTPALSPKRIEESQQTCVLQDSSVTIKDNENLKEIVPKLMEIAEELKALQSDASESKTQIEQLFEQNLNSVLNEASQKLKVTQESLNEQIQTNNNMEDRLIENENKMAQLSKELEQLKAENTNLKEIIEHEKYLRIEKEKESHTLAETNTKLNDDLLKTIQDKNQLQIELLASESDRRKLEDRIELESNNSDCLSIELDIVSQILKRDLQTDEIEWIRNEIEKRKIVKKPDSESNSHQEPTSSRAEYENVLRKKMNLIVQGMEERKNEEIAKLRDIIEQETKEEHSRFVKKLKERIGELEDKLHFYENIGPTTSTVLSPTTSNPAMVASFMSTAMHESCCQVIKDDDEKAQTTSDQQEDDKPDEEEKVIEQGKDDEDEELAVVTISKNSIGTQTKLKMRDLKMMISLTDISQGWAVILFWSNEHNSYCVFSVNNSLYFVKQRSLRSIGIEQNTRPAKSTLIFARIVDVELCETKKAPNRYNLAPNTRFYRVDVSAMPLTGLGSGLPACVANVDANAESSSTKTV